jgi:DNA replication protein DnaC
MPELSRIGVSLGDDLLTEFDWLTHHVHILEINGDSYRLKHTRRK